nr:hypothetical protein [Bacteroidota bacterium]
MEGNLAHHSLIEYKSGSIVLAADLFIKFSKSGIPLSVKGYYEPSVNSINSYNTWINYSSAGNTFHLSQYYDSCINQVSAKSLLCHVDSNGSLIKTNITY